MKKVWILAVLVALAAVGTVSAIVPISFGYNGNLVVTYVSQDASGNNLFGILAPGPVVLGKTRDVTPPQVYTGKGRCSSDKPIVLYIKTPWGLTYRSDIAYNEFKFFSWPPRFVRVDHARVTPGPDGSFTVGFEDTYGGGDKDYNDVVLNVACIRENTAPVATRQFVSTNEDTAKTITLTGSDAEGSPLTFAIATSPSHGTLGSITAAGVVTYTPAPNYFGPDSFTFRVNDGSLDSAPARVSISVHAVNDAPVATPQSVTTDKNTAKAITLAGSDVEGRPLKYAVASTPSHGTLGSIVAGVVTYTPAANYVGSDSFTFRVNDGFLNSAPATVSITVTAVNHAPVAEDDTATTAEDTPADIPVLTNDHDVDTGTTLSIHSITTAPAHGTATIVGTQIHYIPAVTFTGSDTLKYKAYDGMSESNEATVSITVIAVNHAPVAEDDTATTAEDTAADIPVLTNDHDVDTGTILSIHTITVAPAHGTATIVGTQIHYVPEATFTGSDTLKYKAYDGALESNEATVTINVNAVNAAPVAAPQSVSTHKNTGRGITLTGSGHGSLIFNVISGSGPSKGSLSGSAPTLIYTPNPDYTGADSFTFTVNDGTDTSAPAAVFITVTADSVPPVPEFPSVALPAGMIVAIIGVIYFIKSTKQG